jgi:hypothetical protein
MPIDRSDFHLGPATNFTITFDNGVQINSRAVVRVEMEMEQEYMDHFSMGQQVADRRVMLNQLFNFRLSCSGLEYTHGEVKVPSGEVRSPTDLLRLIRFRKRDE